MLTQKGSIHEVNNMLQELWTNFSPKPSIILCSHRTLLQLQGNHHRLLVIARRLRKLRKPR